MSKKPTSDITPKTASAQHAGDGADRSRRRLREAMHLQAIEDNPLSADQVAMFEMFEREEWPHERRLEHIRAWALSVVRK